LRATVPPARAKRELGHTSITMVNGVTIALRLLGHPTLERLRRRTRADNLLCSPIDRRSSEISSDGGFVSPFAR
jgi:hypothetical protein